MEGRHPFRYLFPNVFTDRIPVSELEGLGVLDDDTIDGMVREYFPELLESDSDEEEEEEI